MPDIMAWIKNATDHLVSLERLEKLMELLGYPNRRVKIIEVVENSRKGTVSDTLYRILRHSGYDVGIYSSGKRKVTDAVSVNGAELSYEQIIHHGGRIRSFANEIITSGLGQLTIEEIHVAVALSFFAKESFPDFILWTLDSTEKSHISGVLYPILTVICDWRSDISSKIIHSGVPIVTGNLKPDVSREIKEAAQNKKSSLYLFRRDFLFRSALSFSNELYIHFDGPYRHVEFITITSGKDEDKEPTAVAYMAAEVLRQMYATWIDDDWCRQSS